MLLATILKIIQSYHKFEGLRNTILEQYENSKSPKQRDKGKSFWVNSMPKM